VRQPELDLRVFGQAVPQDRRQPDDPFAIDAHVIVVADRA
jgi:hypothetical protein